MKRPTPDTPKALVVFLIGLGGATELTPVIHSDRKRLRWAVVGYCDAIEFALEIARPEIEEMREQRVAPCKPSQVWRTSQKQLGKSFR